MWMRFCLLLLCVCEGRYLSGMWRRTQENAAIPPSVPPESQHLSRLECFRACQNSNCHGVFFRDHDQQCRLNHNGKEVEEEGETTHLEYWVSPTRQSVRKVIKTLTMMNGKPARSILGTHRENLYILNIEDGIWRKLTWKKSGTFVYQFAYDQDNDRVYWCDRFGDITLATTNNLWETHTYYKAFGQDQVYGLAIDDRMDRVFFASRQPIPSGSKSKLAYANLGQDISGRKEIFSKAKNYFDAFTNVVLDTQSRMVYANSRVSNSVWVCDYEGDKCNSLRVGKEIKFLGFLPKERKLAFPDFRHLAVYHLSIYGISNHFKRSETLHCFLLTQEGFVLFYENSIQVESTDMNQNLGILLPSPQPLHKVVIY